jgi:hypothetical protein
MHKPAAEACCSSGNIVYNKNRLVLIAGLGYKPILSSKLGSTRSATSAFSHGRSSVGLVTAQVYAKSCETHEGRSTSRIHATAFIIDALNHRQRKYKMVGLAREFDIDNRTFNRSKSVSGLTERLKSCYQRW